MTATVKPTRTLFVRSTATLSAVAMAVVMAGCSSGPATHASTSTSVTRTTGSPSTTTTSTPPSAAQTAVLNAWESAEQTLYGYLQGPWQQDRANLVAGETSADLWPKLADYFTNPALQSEDEFLVGVKMGQLNGPTTYNLGHPTVSALLRPTATVTGCIYDTGTTTAAGQPGPATLDGGGAGGYERNLESPARRAARGRSPPSRPRRCRSAEHGGHFDLRVQHDCSVRSRSGLPRKRSQAQVPVAARVAAPTPATP